MTGADCCHQVDEDNRAIQHEFATTRHAEVSSQIARLPSLRLLNDIGDPFDPKLCFIPAGMSAAPLCTTNRAALLQTALRVLFEHRLRASFESPQGVGLKGSTVIPRYYDHGRSRRVWS